MPSRHHVKPWRQKDQDSAFVAVVNILWTPMNHEFLAYTIVVAIVLAIRVVGAFGAIAIAKVPNFYQFQLRCLLLERLK